MPRGGRAMRYWVMAVCELYAIFFLDRGVVGLGCLGLSVLMGGVSKHVFAVFWVVVVVVVVKPFGR